MLDQVGWVVLHGSETHNEGLGFEVWLGGLVALLVVVGALWYLGVFESLTSGGSELEADADSGGGD